MESEAKRKGTFLVLLERLKTLQTLSVFIDWTVMELERVKSLTLTIHGSDRVRDEESKDRTTGFCLSDMAWSRPYLYPTRLSLTSCHITSKSHSRTKVDGPSLRMLNHLTKMSTLSFRRPSFDNSFIYSKKRNQPTNKDRRLTVE